MKQQFIYLVGAIKASALKLIMIILAFLVPIKPLILIVGICIGLDTLFGIWRAKKRKEKIDSRKLSNIISKMILYDMAILLFFAIETFILSDIIGKFTDIPLILTKLVAMTLVSIELTSINESFLVIKGYSLWDKFKDLLKRAKSAKGEIEEFKKEK